MGQVFQVTAEVVAQIADQAAGKRQFKPCGELRFAQARQVVPQALQERRAAFVRPHRQLLQRPGAEQVVTPAFGLGTTTVEQDGTRRMANRREVMGGIGVVGQRVYGAGQHGGRVSHGSAVRDCSPP